MREDKATELEEEYGMPPGRLMYHFYHEREMSAGEIAEEIGEPRNSVKYWLQRAGIKMRSRTLTDTQRIMIIALLSAGMGYGSVASRVGCGEATVYRYRNELEYTGEPVDIGEDISPKDYDILCRLIEEKIATE